MAYPFPSPYPFPSENIKVSRPSFSQTARDIFLREGYRGFFKGLGPCLLRAFPVNASAFFVYEGTLRLLKAEKVSRTLINASTFRSD